MRAMVDAETEALAAGAGRQGGIDAVRDYFYRGEIARKIDAFVKRTTGCCVMKTWPRSALLPEEPVSTTYRGFKVYKPGFWSQGPALLQTLNILEGIDLRGHEASTRPTIFTRLTEAHQAGLCRPRHLLRRSEVLHRVPAERLLSKEYAAERRSADRRPWRRWSSGPAASTATSRLASLRERDRTDADRRRADGARHHLRQCDGQRRRRRSRRLLRGAWLPSVIAGDTGIPLTQRAQSFLLVPGHPNELAGGKRPRITLESHSGHARRQAVSGALHARRRQSGPVAAAVAAQCRRVRHERAGRRWKPRACRRATWCRASTITP